MDVSNPPTSIVEAYLQVAEARTRRLASIPWGDGTRDLADDEEGLLDAALGRKLTVCAQCGASSLEHFYTSKRRGKVLCPACYERRHPDATTLEQTPHDDPPTKATLTANRDTEAYWPCC